MNEHTKQTELLELGPLEPLLADETVSEVLVDGPAKIYVERRGKFEDVNARFRDDEHLMRYIRRILMPLGRRADESSPIVDARLPDGSRVNVVIPPISIVGPALTIRKVSKTPLTVEDLLRFGSWSEDIVAFLRACVIARLNIVVAGGAGSGKTTLLNMMIGMIPSDERVVTVEQQAELQPRGIEHLVRLESRPPNWAGEGEVSMSDLVVNALRMRPDRIILSEARTGEMLDLLRAINTGHDGTMINMHAAGPQDALDRLETMMLMANPALPTRVVRHEIASAIDLIVHQERLPDGSRKIVEVSEVSGVQGEAIMLQDIFEFRQTGSVEGKVTGYHTASGTIPRCMERITAADIDLPMDVFVPK
jgi:pilus assembly protein CpaF